MTLRQPAHPLITPRCHTHAVARASCALFYGLCLWQVCGKALEADDEELEQQKQHFTGQTEAGKTPIQGPSGQQPPETPPQQSQQAQARTATEGKEAELSGGEKISERREGGQQAQAGQQQPQRQRRYLIHEFPGHFSNTLILCAACLCSMPL